MANSASHAALPYPIKGARFTVAVPYLDADGDPTDPTTPDTEVSKDGGAYADCAEEVSTITGSNGSGYITLSGAETDCSFLMLAAKVASGPKATLLTLYPRLLADLENGTAQAGATGSITLASGATAHDISGCFVKTTGGTGGGGTGGANNQVRRIVSYNTSSKVATVEPNWETTPSSDTTYDILVPEGLTVGAVKALNPTTDGRTVDILSTGEAAANVTHYGGSAGTFASGRPEVNTTLIEGSDATDQINVACDTALTDYDAVVPADLPTNFADLSITATTGRVDVANIEGSDATDQINAAVDSALDTAIPGSPTANSINERIAALDDLLESGGGGDAAAIKAVTDALTSAAAASLAASAGTIVTGTVDTVTNGHTPTTTEFQADDITEATADHFKGRIVIFTSGALANQATDITAYSQVGGIGQFTVTAMTEAPANNDTFVII